MDTSYQNTIQEILKHLNERKVLILKRTLLIIWPFLLLIASVSFFWRESFFNDVDPSIFKLIGHSAMNFWQTLTIIGMAIFAILYTFILKIIFNIEKNLWIDSYFDGKNLPPNKSFKISMRLFPATITFGTKIFIKYYLAILITYFLYVLSIIYFFLNYFKLKETNLFYVILIAIFITPILLYTWQYYLKIKMRNVWFIFLDFYNTEKIDFKTLTNEINEINKITKSEDFKKILLVNIGVDSVSALTSQIIRLSSSIGGNQSMLGNMVGTYTQELNNQVRSFSTIIANYIFYRLARKQKTGEGQKINEAIYSLE